MINNNKIILSILFISTSIVVWGTNLGLTISKIRLSLLIRRMFDLLLTISTCWDYFI